MPFLSLRLFTIITWLAALIGYIYSIRIYPKEQRKERFWYSAIILSYIVHVIVFYIFTIIFAPTPGSTVFTTWSNTIRIHGGLAITIKEILAIRRVQLFRKGDN